MDFTPFKKLQQKLQQLDKKTLHYIGYGAVATVSIIAIVSLICLQRNWPSDRYEELGFTRSSEKATIQPVKRSTAEIAEAEYSYEEAIAAYSGRRFQFSNCSVTPTSITFKNGTRVMLDSKSADPQKITIGTASMIINGFDQGYMTLSSKSLPTTLSVNCQTLGEDHYNISTIVLQP